MGPVLLRIVRGLALLMARSISRPNLLSANSWQTIHERLGLTSGGMKDFFVSYSGADHEWAEWISWQLEAANYTVVVQAWDFVGNWVLDMDKATRETERTIIVLSPAFAASAYTQPEWAEAFRRDPTGAKGILIPLRVREVTLTGLLAQIVFTDLVGTDEATARELLLNRVSGRRGKPQVASPFPRQKPSFPSAAPPAGPAPIAPATTDLDKPGLFHAPAPDWQSPIERNTGRYKVVAFDLDGTLLRAKLSFSWELVWSELKFAKSLRHDLRAVYRRDAALEPSNRIAAYRAWCEAAVQHFRARRLTREQLRKVAGAVSLTRNCREALRQLRAAGVVTAVISGGIHTFLEDCFADFRDFVDFAFINQLSFDDAGVVSGVRATAYDFEGKADALDYVCQRAQCTREEAAFVGDQFNDETIMLSAGISIAYPPGNSVAEDASHLAIAEDDLCAILPHVLVS
jgi:HAD superfamily phosphoserine phosphatase-like hydrolase